MRPLEDRPVLITGVARGIGLCIAQRLHDDGARVLMIDRDESVLNVSGGICAW